MTRTSTRGALRSVWAGLEAEGWPTQGATPQLRHMLPTITAITAYITTITALITTMSAVMTVTVPVGKV